MESEEPTSFNKRVSEVTCFYKGSLGKMGAGLEYMDIPGHQNIEKKKFILSLIASIGVSMFLERI